MRKFAQKQLLMLSVAQSAQFYPLRVVLSK
jgi:hypothetical protein